MFSRLVFLSTPSMQRETKGSNFKPDDDLALAKCWLAVSQQTREQNAETFWARVADQFAQHNALHSRSPASLKCRWNTVQKVTQKYLAANKLYRANIPSGETEKDTIGNVMQLYRERNATVDKEGTRKVAAPVRFLDAVMLLSTHPKFSAVIGGNGGNGYGSGGNGGNGIVRVGGVLSTSSSGVRCGERDAVLLEQTNVTHEAPSVPGSSGNIGMAAPFRSRPLGVKRDRAENAAEGGAYKMAKSMERVSVAIENSTKAKLLASSVAIQFKIIKSLPLREEERGLKLMELLSKVSSMETGETHGSSETEPNEGGAITVEGSSN